MAHPPFSGGWSSKEALVEAKFPPSSAWVGLVWGWASKRKGKGNPLPFFHLSGGTQTFCHDYCFGMEIKKKQKTIPNSAESGRELSRDLERTAEIWRSQIFLKILKDPYSIIWYLRIYTSIFWMKSQNLRGILQPRLGELFFLFLVDPQFIPQQFSRDLEVLGVPKCIYLSIPKDSKSVYTHLPI